MAAPSVVQWLSNELSKLLEIEVPRDMASYILAIEAQNDLIDYLKELLEGVSVKHRDRFIDDVLRRWRNPQALPANMQVYKKDDEREIFVQGREKKQKKKAKKMQETVNMHPAPSQSSQPSMNGALPLKEIPYGPPEPKKKQAKEKFIPLFSEEGSKRTAAKLPGRHKCDCQASKHSLINNCVSCGRVVCEQEGSGPCLHCGSLVCTRSEQEVLSRGSKKSEKLRQELMDKGGDILPNAATKLVDDLERATRHKNKLLEYDRTSVKRTQVLDDESDYFATESNRWLSKTEKTKLKKREDELREARHGSRLNRKVTIDFAGRQVVEDAGVTDIYNVDDEVIQEVHYGKGGKSSQPLDEPLFTDEDFSDLVNPNIKWNPPQFVVDEDNVWHNRLEEELTALPEAVEADEKKRSLRIQDRELKEMSDEGMCMSMHQPWASLLTHGIKKHEGRSWYTPHRGRLWIAATGKTPSPEEIAEVEQQYRYHYNDPTLEFPQDYPIGCLLGCVDVENCLPQDEYRNMYPDGESGSPFVFVCQNPRELIVKFPIKGRHKIYKLDGQIHQAAKKGIR